MAPQWCVTVNQRLDRVENVEPSLSTRRRAKTPHLPNGFRQQPFGPANLPSLLKITFVPYEDWILQITTARQCIHSAVLLMRNVL